MNIFERYINKLLLSFNTSKVNYLVAGGYAVNFYAYE